jgi:Tfp pilus assembly protein PilX
VRKQIGAATLLITFVLFLAAIFLMLYAVNFSRLQQKTASNSYNSNQAFEAAEAGLEFGMAYLNTNSATITASPTNGYINYGSANSSLTNVSLANNAKFSVVYTNPTQNNYLLIQVTSTGTSADGSSTRTVRQQVYGGTSALKYAITTQQNFTASGNVTVTGQNGVNAGGTVTGSGNINISQTTANDTALANLSSDTLFSNIFGMSKSSMQSQSTYYASGSGVNYSNLSGNVWINSGVSISGNATIGTQANPVLLIVNGNFTGSGTATIYGVIYVMGTTTVSGNFTVNGGLVSQGSITMSGTSSAYNAQIVSQLTAHGFSRVTGSWKDF